MISTALLDHALEARRHRAGAPSFDAALGNGGTRRERRPPCGCRAQPGRRGAVGDLLARMPFAATGKPISRTGGGRLVLAARRGRRRRPPPPIFASRRWHSSSPITNAGRGVQGRRSVHFGSAGSQSGAWRGRRPHCASLRRPTALSNSSEDAASPRLPGTPALLEATRARPGKRSCRCGHAIR